MGKKSSGDDGGVRKCKDCAVPKKFDGGTLCATCSAKRARARWVEIRKRTRAAEGTEKPCQRCGAVIFRAAHVGLARWSERRLCSVCCRSPRKKYPDTWPCNDCGATLKKKPSVVPALRCASCDYKWRHPTRELYGVPLITAELAHLAGCSVAAMNQRLQGLTPEAAVALGSDPRRRKKGDQ
jgi:hypothetical protein